MRACYHFALVVLLLPSCRARAQETIVADGHRYEVMRAGSGPLIVLEAGLGNDARSWGEFADSVAKVGRVFAYSRAGYGGSEMRTEPRTPEQLAHELHALLAAAGEKGPFIIAAHSIGGMYARVYASLYPKDIRGLVLIDGSHEHQFLTLMQLDSTTALASRDYQLSRGTDTAAGAETAAFVAVFDVGVLPAAQSHLPDVPIAALTSMRVSGTTGYGSPAGRDAWRALHGSILDQVSHGVQFTTATSGHYIFRDEPALVMEALRWVLVRAK